MLHFLNKICLKDLTLKLDCETPVVMSSDSPLGWKSFQLSEFPFKEFTSKFLLSDAQYRSLICAVPPFSQQSFLVCSTDVYQRTSRTYDLIVGPTHKESSVLWESIIHDCNPTVDLFKTYLESIKVLSKKLFKFKFASMSVIIMQAAKYFNNMFTIL